MTPLLEVEGLVVEMRRHRVAFHAVDGVSFALERGGALAIVGESGCGKSLTLRAIMGLLPNRGRLASGRVIVDGVTLRSDARGRGRGHGQHRRMSIVFQDALSALNPVATVGNQIAEAPRHVLGLGRSASRARALELLRLVGIPDPERRYHAYPHELSGGTRQRVMIAIALSSDPAILLCDEPTTSLDVTIQTQILALLAELRSERGLSLVFEPIAIPGSLPDPLRLTSGCSFQPRCQFATPECVTTDVRLERVGPGQEAACLHSDVLSAAEAAGRHG